MWFHRDTLYLVLTRILWQIFPGSQPIRHKGQGQVFAECDWGITHRDRPAKCQANRCNQWKCFVTLERIATKCNQNGRNAKHCTVNYFKLNLWWLCYACFVVRVLFLNNQLGCLDVRAIYLLSWFADATPALVTISVIKYRKTISKAEQKPEDNLEIVKKLQVDYCFVEAVQESDL